MTPTQSSDIQKIYDTQRAKRWRVAQSTAEERILKLKKLRQAIFDTQTELQKAIYDDFRKNPAEVDLTETNLVIAEINDAIKHLPRWMKPQPVKTPMVLFGTSSAIHYEPKGLALILSPWNYPFQLAVSPVVAAIAAGNCVILKPSNKTPHTARYLKRLLSDVFAEDEVAVFEGDHTIADALLEMPFDHIFFTGSTHIGKKVMAAAAKHLAPVTLELGGKSPVIIDQTADIKKSAARIAWGKLINAGQTCVAPDYVLIHESKAKDFIAEIKRVIAERYGADPKTQLQSTDYCRLVSEAHREGLVKILKEAVESGATIETGGSAEGDSRFFPPTILSQVSESNPIMREEIFGPILPVLTYSDLDEAIALVQKKEKPLALYIFSENPQHIHRVLRATTAGGTCINNLAIHLANPNLPFGGVGWSGMGSYHGFFGFKTFSHERAVLRQGPIDLLKSFYPPYTPRLQKIIRWFTRYLA